MFLCPFYISDIPGLTLEILKILIPLCFRDALQQFTCQFVSINI